MSGDRPRTAREWFEIGSRLIADNEPVKALEYLEKARRIDPHQPAIPANIGIALADRGLTDEARSSFDDAIRLAGSGSGPLRMRKALVRPVISSSREEIALDRAGFEEELDALAGERFGLQDPQLQLGNPYFYLTYQAQNDRDLLASLANLMLKKCPALEFVAPQKPATGERLKVGFFSAHFRDHTVGYVNRGLIERLDRRRFEAVVIRPNLAGDETGRDIEQAADSVVTVPYHFGPAREIIARLELDILLFTDIGLEPMSYFLAFSRLAPVQAVLWGHPSTTGIPNVDYYVSSVPFEGEGGQAFYSERLVTLPHHPIYLGRPVNEGGPVAREQLGVRPDEHLYLCPQSLFKLHPDFDLLVDGILERDPQGIVCIPSGPEPFWQEKLEARFRRNCPETHSRIRFIPRIAPKQFLASLRHADAILDPPHFTGGYTSYLALSAGVPIVTWPGEMLRSRMTAGLYRIMGVSGLTVDSAESYIDLAVRLGSDPEFRASCSEDIRAGSSSLFDDQAAIQEFEEFLVAAHSASSGGGRLTVSLR